MKIIPNFVKNIKSNKAAPTFTSALLQASPSSTSDNISTTTTDYNVRVPIAHNQLEDIKLADGLSAKCYKLANGQKVVIVPKDGPTVVKSYVNTGSFNEPDHLRGISHYIEHNLFNGSDELGEQDFFAEVNKMGANTNASTSFANTNYFISSNLLDDKDLEKKIQLHAGMIQSPKFLLEKLEKEKKIVNSEINMCVSENENLGYTQTVKNLFNINSTSLDLVAGSTDNITNLKREDVVKYFNDNYYPANITTVITGEVDPDETIKLISKYFNSTKAPQGQRHFETMLPIEKPVRQDIISQKSDSGAATVFIGFAGPENNNTKDKIYLQALSNLAGGLYNSRTANLERKYGTSISFYPDRLSSRPQDKSLMLIETRVSEGKAEMLLNELYKEIYKLSKVPPTQQELTAIKNKMKKSFDQIFESSHGLNSMLGTAFLNNNIDYLKEYNKIVDDMTADDIVNAAKKYLNLNKAALTVVHPNGLTEDQIKARHALITKMDEYNVSFTGTNKKTPLAIDNVKTYRANNNFEIVLNNANTNTIQYKFSLKEQKWDPKNTAISDILSDMLENAGTKTKTVEGLSKTADILGIHSGIYANDYGIQLTADFPINTTKESLAYINDKIKHPNLNEKEFNAALERVKDHYSNIEPNPYDNFCSSIYKGTALAATPSEILKTIDTIKLEDVKAFYNEIFSNGQGQVTVTGPFEKHPELKLEIFGDISNYNEVKPYDTSLEKIFTPVEKSEVLTNTSLKNQADIIQGYRFKNNGNIKDAGCVALLNMILGGSASSRLFTDLREKRHLAYSVHSDYSKLGDMGVFLLSIGTTTENQETGEKTFDNVKKAITGFSENIQKMMNEKVTHQELEAAKKQLKSDILNSIELNSHKNNTISNAKTTPYGIKYLNQYYENIDSITAEDIQNTAKNIFNSKPIYSITATKDTLEYNKEYFEKLKEN